MITTLLATALMTTATPNTADTPPANEQDSAAYAVGVFIAYNANNIDSTLDAGILMDAVNDVYSKNFEKKMKEAQAYLTAVQIAQQAYYGVDSTMAPTVIAEGIADMMNQKSIIDPEEANRYITNYIGKLSLKALLKTADEFLARADAEPGVQKTATGLRYKIEAPGTGEKIGATETVMVHFVSTDYEGRIYKSTYDNHGRPLRIDLRKSNVTSGFAEGIQLLAKGGKATLWLSPEHLDYDPDDIYAPEALKYEIEVLDIPIAKEKYQESAESKSEYESEIDGYHKEINDNKFYKALYKEQIGSYTGYQQCTHDLKLYKKKEKRYKKFHKATEKSNKKHFNEQRRNSKLNINPPTPLATNY